MGEYQSHGFQDTRTMTVVYPNLEIGDQAVLDPAGCRWCPGS